MFHPRFIESHFLNYRMGLNSSMSQQRLVGMPHVPPEALRAQQVHSRHPQNGPENLYLGPVFVSVGPGHLAEKFYYSALFWILAIFICDMLL